ncbi:somatostatin 6 [Clupea harengus]|uniref:Somatostatin 6 n=1 Tax=Clupea harengus TaxID=7950 RepID=A0A8M1KGY6_CLUHA|nr:somatostatin 6 [Clupea harengus]XP_042561574.1 somatostatin 6 [Clupea harengus]
MGVLARVDPCSVAQSARITMRVLTSLVPLILIVWSGSQTGALPVREKPLRNESLADEERILLLKILAGLTEKNLTEENLTGHDLEGLLNGTLKGGSVPTPQERSPCKNFFWKTFSSC